MWHKVGDMDTIKRGDIIWQSRPPGGWCIVLEIIEYGSENDKGWAKVDYPIYKVCHPIEGIIEDASYYYQTVERYKEVASRIWKDGKIVGYLPAERAVPYISTEGGEE